MLKVVVPTDARLAVLAYGTNDFGRLYINGQASPYNLAMAAGLDAATASNIQNSDDDGRDKIELGAYPVPFGESLSITVRGTVADGALLQLLDHQGMPVQAISLKGGQQKLRSASATCPTCAQACTRFACSADVPSPPSAFEG